MTDHSNRERAAVDVLTLLPGRSPISPGCSFD